MIPLLAEILDKDIFEEKFLPICLEWLSNSVYQIREESIDVLIQLAEKLFDQRWLEKIMTEKIQEFYVSEKFAQRNHAISMMAKLVGQVSDRCINDQFFTFVEKFIDDPVPNIRFGVCKTIIAMHQSFTNQRKQQIKKLLAKLDNDTDDDVCYFSEQA